MKVAWATPPTTATLLTVPKFPTVKFTVPPVGVPAAPPPTLARSVTVWPLEALKLIAGAMTLTVVAVGAPTGPGGGTIPGGSTTPGGRTTPGGSTMSGGRITPGGSTTPGARMVPAGMIPAPGPTGTVRASSTSTIGRYDQRRRGCLVGRAAPQTRRNKPAGNVV